MSVPVGTQVYRDDELLADLAAKDMRAVIARGGDGGFGNAHFKSSTRQTPRVAELGERGDEFEARLELKLLADVGLVGLPNAGKSTFLSVVSNARPEIADYPFTTLTPNLGVADIDETSLLIADIPGLIEGASEGKGLGDAFLRHVERTSVLLHLVDAYSDDVARDYQTVRAELSRYNAELSDRPEVVALTKIEGLDDELIAMQTDALKAVIAPKTPLYAISSAAHRGLDEVLRELTKIVAATAITESVMTETESDETIPTITLPDRRIDEAWQVTKDEAGFTVSGTKIEKFAIRTDYGNVHSINRLRDIMGKMGIAHELLRAGANGADTVTIAGHSFTMEEQ